MRRICLATLIAALQGFGLGVGGGYFWGDDAAEAFLPVESDGSWTYVELTWKR